MFARLPDVVADVPVVIDGVPHYARAGDTVAAALLANGIATFRTTAISGAPRGPFCLMGACFECMVEVDGVPVQGCLARVHAGARIGTMHGARGIDPVPAAMGDSFVMSRDADAGHAKAASSDVIDVVVVGAGPAGLAAAAACARAGLVAVVYDEQASPGGQVYRAITASPLARPEILGDDYWRGAASIVDFLRAGARYVPGATVWSVTPHDDGFLVALGIARGDSRAASTAQARAVVLATGALERPMPIPGWTLPGVVMAGGAQAVLKSAGVVPQGRTVLAGCGPLLWLVAAQYLRAGVRIDAMLDTTPRGRLAQALRHAPAFVASAYFAKGRELVRYVRRRTRVVEYVEVIALEGDTAVAAVRFRHRGGEEHIAADQVLLHQGVVPDINLASAAGCALAWNDTQACFAPVVDDWGGSSVAGLYIAGDGAGIAGAEAAAVRGTLAGLAVANALGRLDASARDHAAQAAMRALQQASRGRRFLDVLHRAPDGFRIPAGHTLACRCEEVPAQAIRDLARSGTAGPNQMKALTRCGMGPCQGRYCALTVTELIAAETGRTPTEVGTYRCRFPAKPVPLAEIAAMPATPEDVGAVERDGDSRLPQFQRIYS